MISSFVRVPLMAGILLAGGLMFLPTALYAQEEAPEAGAQEAPTESGTVAEDPADDPATAEAAADGRGKVEKGPDGKYYTEEGLPTYNIAEDGTVDWYTYSGFRRYHGTCHQCHGPDAMGSTYAPALVESLKRMSYADFMETVVNGRQNGNSVMPSFGTNPNVMCYIDDLYIYLTARADGALPRGRPAEREDKPDAASEAEDACFGT